MDWLWSAILTAVGLTGFVLAGKKVWWAWYVNFFCQFIWFAFGVVTQQWGFLVAAIFYMVVFGRNAYQWTEDDRAKKREALKKEVYDKVDKLYTTRLSE